MIARLSLVMAAICVCALAAIAQQAPPTAPVAQPGTAIKWTVNGYVQGRITDTFGEDTVPSSIDIRRAYINAIAEVDEHISGVIMVGGFPSVTVFEAYGQYKFNPEFKARLGLSRIPFGYELPLSSSGLITLERSQAVSALLATDFTFDRGLYAYYTPANCPINLSAGITNGTPPGTKADTNDHKNFVARLGYDIPGLGQVGASVYDGKNPTGDTMDRLGADLRLTKGDFTLIGEALTGRTGTVDAAGAYATLAYRKPGTASQPYLRLDTFDPNTDTSNNNYRRATIGYSYYLKGNNKLTLEYQAIDDELNPDVDGALGFQYQVVF